MIIMKKAIFPDIESFLKKFDFKIFNILEVQQIQLILKPIGLRFYFTTQK